VADGPPAEALTRERVREVFRVDPTLLAAPWPSDELASAT
jgi:hypothetical protein